MSEEGLRLKRTRVSPRVAVWIVATSLVLFLPLRAAQATSTSVLPPVTDADGRFGLCDVLPGNTPSATNPTSWAQLAYNAGARTNRWEFRWDRIEPKVNQWSFSADDAAVAASGKYGLDIDGIIDGIPRWAAAKGQPPGNGVPAGLAFGINDPRNTWASFLHGLVAHYKGQVKYWEIWNEPDLHFFWNGTSKDYFELLRVADSVIKEVDPSAQVLVAGMVVPDLKFLTQVLGFSAQWVAKGHAAPFDIVAWHAYGNAVALYGNLQHIDALLAARGFSSVPVWVTEDGFPASNPQGEARQAAYVMQTMAYALAAGAQRVLIYRASDDPTPKTWGLLTAAGAPRMGYDAFQVAAHYFARVQAITYAPSGNLERFVLYKPYRRITLLWSRALVNQNVNLYAAQSQASVVDWQGNTSVLTPTNGVIQATAPGASYNAGIDPSSAVVGGPPLLVVEDNTPPAALPVAAYIPSVAGQSRLAIVSNPAPVAAVVQVSAADDPNEREVVRLDPDTARIVDLDLLAGPDYSGMYSVASTAPVNLEAASNEVTLPAEMPATSWYAPSSPATLSFENPTAKSTSVRVLARAASGKVLSSWKQSVSAHGSVLVDRSQLAGNGMVSIQVQSGAGMIPMNPRGRVAPQPSTSWYALGSQTTRLAVFNPGTSTAMIDVKYLGASAINAEQLSLLPHQSARLPHQRSEGHRGDGYQSRSRRRRQQFHHRPGAANSSCYRCRPGSGRCYHSRSALQSVHAAGACDPRRHDDRRYAPDHANAGSVTGDIGRRAGANWTTRRHHCQQRRSGRRRRGHLTVLWPGHEC